MAVDSVGSADAVNYVGEQSTQSKSNTSLDAADFLTLLVKQLQYQDPLEPQTDNSFVTQLAQMTSLEQMQQMNASLSSAQAYNMLGKTVYAEVLNSSTGETDCYTGTVDRIVLKNSVPYVVVGKTAISVSNVLQVYEPADTDKTQASGSETAAGKDTQTV